MQTIIRVMTLADIPEIVNLDLTIIGESLGEVILKDHLENSELMKYWIMEETEHSQIIGMMSLWVDEDKAQINNFYILPKYQGQKLGRSFLEYIISYLRAGKIAEVTLEVRASNHKAIALYESSGFRSVSIRKNYYSNGEDAHLMYLRIGSD